jgi:hypothetical protein
MIDGIASLLNQKDRSALYDIVPQDNTRETEALRLEVYIWPMIIEYRHGAQKLLVRAPLAGRAQ